MRKLILTLAILVLIVPVASAQTGPAPEHPASFTQESPDKTLEADKKRIQDRWNSQPGTVSKKAAKTKKPGNQPEPVKSNTP